LSTPLPWTKLQDFYLRLGFLKLLAACLSEERRSASNDSIVRRLERPMFDAVGNRQGLWPVASLVAATTAKKGAAPRKAEEVEVVECLVADACVPSALYAVTRDTAYKILDWGRDVGILVRANQISERGLILKSLLPADRASRFVGGDALAWNPFALTASERMFFLFNALEQDSVTAGLVERLAELEPGACIETREASRMTCSTLFQMLEATEQFADAASIQAHRTALDLALTMAEEVDAAVPEHWARQAVRAQFVRATRSAMKRKPGVVGKADSGRKTTKNADHQTIPRFEQLVDLGFLEKPGANDPDPAVALGSRRRWRYAPTTACRRWAAAIRRPAIGGNPGSRFSAFSLASVSAFGTAVGAGQSNVEVADVAVRTWHAYLAVGRKVGMTPLDSIALRAMLDASADGQVLEMASIHRFFVIVKRKSLLSDVVSFAAGSELNTMFVRIKPGFLAGVPSVLGELQKEWNSGVG
jgi:hypothetical protein